MLKVNNKIIKINNKWLNCNSVPDPYNPLNLPPYTIRLKYPSNYSTNNWLNKGTATQVSSSEGYTIWDVTYENSDWSQLIYAYYLYEILGANTTGVTNMSQLFETGSNFTYCPLFDTSSVTNMSKMFWECNGLTTIPLFDTHNVTNMSEMFVRTPITNIPLFDTSNVSNVNYTFYQCYNVQTGALALYQQMSSQIYPPNNHSGTFYNCGSDTTTGAAELAQIPSDWGGTGV